MAQEIADSKLLDTWGSGGAQIEPDISKIIEGWQLGEQPPHEYMNWLQNTFGSKLNHILKNGIAEWNNETEYLAGSGVKHNGSIWLCETTNTNSEPTDLNANWEKVAINKDLTVTVDTLADLRSISSPANTVWASGYHAKNDGAFGSHIFRLKGVKTTETDNGGTAIIATIGGIDYVYELQYDGAVNVKWFGAKGDGVTDDTVAIQKAFSIGQNVKYGRYNYNISDSIPITSNMTVDSYGSTINWTGLSTVPLYTITAPASEISITGGLYIGSPSAWVYALGATENPLTMNDYARFKVSDVHVNGAIIFIDAQKAARFKINNVQTYTASGINMNGKIVETKISDSIIFGSTAGVGTYGIKSKLYDGANTSSYPEGLHIVNSTLDNFERTLEIYDIFVMIISNSYIGDVTNNKLPIYIKKGASTHCREITFNGNTINGGIEFDVISSGYQYNAVINNNNFINTNFASIYLKNNTYQVKIEGNKFNDSSSLTDGFAVLITDNVGDIDVANNSVDSTYTRIFQSSGSNGANINVINNYSTISTPISVSRPINNKNNGIANDILKVNLTGTVTAGNYWANSITTNFAKGEKFLLTINSGFSTTTTGYLVVELPTGLIPSKGTGWSDTFMYIGINQNNTKIGNTLMLYAETDGSGSIKLKNNDIATVNTGYHGVMSLAKL